jgi:hypothetical protein
MGKNLSTYASKLKYFFAIEVFLVVLYRLLDTFQESNDIQFWRNTFFIIPLIFGVFTVFYAFNIKCKNPECHARQVFRGLSFFDIRWPSSDCYKCGTPLEAKKN